VDTSSGEPNVEELRRLVTAQRELMAAHTARITALEDSLAAALAPAGLEVGESEADAQEREGLVATRGVFLRTAAAGAAGLAGASIATGWGGGVAQAAGAQPGMIGSWIVSIVYKSRHERTRGLATITSDGGFMGSVSAYEQAPARATPSRGTALHGSWVATGPRKYQINAVRLHLSGRGELLGVMSTQIAATIANDFRTWDGSFTFNAAHPDGHLLSRGTGTLHAKRIPMPH